MDETVAKLCIKSTLRYGSTVSALKGQLEEVTEELRAKEKANHRLQEALVRGQRQLPVSDAESHDVLPQSDHAHEAQLAEHLHHFTQQETKADGSQPKSSQELVSEPQATSDFSVSSPDITLASFFSKETERKGTSPGKDAESCDTKRQCLQKLADGQDGFIGNIDFETLFKRELSEKSVS